MMEGSQPPPLDDISPDEKTNSDDDMFTSAVDTMQKRKPNGIAETLNDDDDDDDDEEEIDLQGSGDLQHHPGHFQPSPVSHPQLKVDLSHSPAELSSEPAYASAKSDFESSSPASLKPTSAISSGTPIAHSVSKAAEEADDPELDDESSDLFVEIKVSEAKKIGDGMNSYMVYRVTTKTNVPAFRKQEFSVSRRFSDFLGLHEKLLGKYLTYGRIVPPPPEKSAIGMAKVKMTKDDSGALDFVERRRASLERYVNRTARHPALCVDPDFREFLELQEDLPKATSTSALSGAGVLRFFSRAVDTVGKMTLKMDETDQWFEEKQQQVESLQHQMKKLHSSVETLVTYRRELATNIRTFATSSAVLASAEEHSGLSRALSQLADAYEKLEGVYGQQAETDFYVLAELIRDYLALLDAIKECFHQRVKTYQTWQYAQGMLTKKREAKVKLELAMKTDKLPQADEEIKEWEQKVQKGEEDFKAISKMVRKEVKRYERYRVQDFKDAMIKYLEVMLQGQQEVLRVWENYLPEAKSIA